MAHHVEFIGHCDEGGHNKVWGWIAADGGEYFQFWGKFGATLAFKHFSGPRALDDLQRAAKKKMRPRPTGQYHEVNVRDLDNVIPGFSEELEKQAAMAKLFDNFR